MRLRHVLHYNVYWTLDALHVFYYNLTCWEEKFLYHLIVEI